MAIGASASRQQGRRPAGGRAAGGAVSPLQGGGGGVRVRTPRSDGDWGIGEKRTNRGRRPRGRRPRSLPASRLASAWASGAGCFGPSEGARRWESCCLRWPLMGLGLELD